MIITVRLNQLTQCAIPAMFEDEVQVLIIQKSVHYINYEWQTLELFQNGFFAHHRFLFVQFYQHLFV